MADTETRSHSDGAPEAAARACAKADDAVQAASETVKAEQRSFAQAGETARRAAGQAADQATAVAQSGLKAGRDLAEASHEAMRRAGGQAVDLWRSSLDPLTNMQSELSRWFEQTWRTGLPGHMQNAPLFGEAVFAALSGAPTSDLYETPDGLELVVELPGLTAQDIHLALKGDSLIVSGERSQITDRSDGGYRVRERRLGGFQRAFTLPADVDRKAIEARFDKGVLTVTVPRAGGAEPEGRTIPIKG